MAEWFVLDYEAGNPVQSLVGVGLLTGYSVLDGNLLPGTVGSSIGLDWENRGGNDTHHGLCWK